MPRLAVAAALLIALASLLAGCGKPAATGPLGSSGNPVKMAFVPSLETGSITVSAETLVKAIEKETGLDIEVSVPVSYAAVIEAMGAGRVDVAWFAPLSYVLAHKNVGADVMLITKRDGYTHYFGIILVRSDSGIKTLKDLKGKKFAFVDPLSTSGTLYPKDLLKRNGIDPEKDLQSIYSGGHDKAIIALYNKQVDACSCYGGYKQDARSRVKATIPDVMAKTTIIGKTAEIPNDNVSASKTLPADIRKKMSDALLKISATAEGRKMLLDVADIEGLEPATDPQYDSVRKMASVLGLDLENAVTSEGPKKMPAKK